MSKILPFKIEKLESIRGFAAVYVVIHHFFGFTELKNVSPLLRLPFRFGQEAVILFFLMSGFVINFAFKKARNKSFSDFFKKRFIRIYPIFLLSIVLSVVVNIINHNYVLDYKSLWGNSFMLQSQQHLPGSMFPVFLNNHALWSLSYEWWFYLLFFPITMYICPKAKSNDIYYILLISVLSFLLYVYIPNHLFSVLSYLVMWWSGVAVSEKYMENKELTFKSLKAVYISLLVMTLLTSVPILIAYLSGFRDFHAIEFPIITCRHFAFSLVAILIAQYWHNSIFFKSNFLLNFFARIAPISYGMYCLHFPIIFLSVPFIKNLYLIIFLKIVLVLIASSFAELTFQPYCNKIFRKYFFKSKNELPYSASINAY